MRGAALGLSLLATGAAAETVDLELVLMADATGSIDRAELMFQRQGHAEALLSDEVLSAIASGFDGKIAVTYVEWADMFSQNVVVPWTVVDDRASAEAFVAELMAAPRRAFGRNAIGSAIARGVTLFDENNYEGFRKVIDFAADSANNWGGLPIEDARARAASEGIVINGLAVLCRAEDCSGRPVNYDLEQAFAERIITGPGSFVVTAEDGRSFADAVRQKLILEIAGTTPAGEVHVAADD